MPQSKKKPKKTREAGKYKMIFLPSSPSSETSPEQHDDEETGGMYVEKDDLTLIYNALRAYRPTEKEKVLHSTLLEVFEEILVVEFGEPYPEVN